LPSQSPWSIPCFPLPSQHPVPFLVSPCPHNPHGV
jgi:hypothetical protein